MVKITFEQGMLLNWVAENIKGAAEVALKLNFKKPCDISEHEIFVRIDYSIGAFESDHFVVVYIHRGYDITRESVREFLIAFLLKDSIYRRAIEWRILLVFHRIC